MTGELKLALSASIGLHLTALVGLPGTQPVTFDIERAPTSVELYLAQSPSPPAVVSQPPEEKVLEPEQPMPEQPHPAPQTTASDAHRGAITEVLPNYLRNPPPIYPSQARMRGDEGTVVLEVEVLPSGRSGIVNILTSSGSELLDDAARRAVQEWRFRPARRWNHAVSFWVEIPMTFRLIESQGG